MRTDPNGRSERSAWAYLNLGLQFAVTVAVLAAAGWWLDERYGWQPWGVISGAMVGVAAGTYQLLKETL